MTSSKSYESLLAEDHREEEDDDDNEMQDVPLAEEELDDRPSSHIRQLSSSSSSLGIFDWLSTKKRKLLIAGAVAVALMILVVLAAIFLVYRSGGNIETDDSSNSGRRLWLVSSARRSILPPVNNSTDYISYDDFPIDDETAGVFVNAFDHGSISVGSTPNSSAHWVRSPLFVRCLAISQLPPDSPVAVFLVAELHQLYRQDLAPFYARLSAQLTALGRPDLYRRLHIIFHTQSNSYAAPDTSGLAGPINSQYLSFLIDQLVAATVDAVALQQFTPAYLTHGLAPFFYGLDDTRDPIFQDNNVRVIRASAVDTDRVLATIVQWNYRPENAKDYQARFNADDCQALSSGSNSTWQCSSQGNFLFADFPGALANRMIELQGGAGEVLYFNGAIGSHIGPYAPIWVPTSTESIGNGFERPTNAQDVASPSIYRANLVGQALANFAHGIARPHSIANTTFEFLSSDFWLPVTNFVFLAGSVGGRLGDTQKPLLYGNSLRDMWSCQPPNQPSEANCVLTTEVVLDSKTNTSYRSATHLKSVVSYLRLGNAQIITAPLALAPELCVGLPQNFDDEDEERTAELYYNRPHYHAVGEHFTLPGVLFQTLPSLGDNSLQLLVGSSGDALGDALSVSDVRYICPQARTACIIARNAGAMNYSNPDMTGDFDVSLAGEQCVKAFMNPQATRALYEAQFGESGSDFAALIFETCQHIGARTPSGYFVYDHYEESKALFADLGRVYLEAVASLLHTKPKGRFCKGGYCSGVGRHSQT